MGTVFASLHIAGEELGLGGDLLDDARDGRSVVEDDFDFGPQRPGRKQRGRDEGSNPGLRLFQQRGDRTASGNQIAGADGNGLDAGARGRADFDFGELNRDLGNFGLGLVDAGPGLREFFGAGAESGNGGDLFSLQGPLLGGLDVLHSGAGLEQGQALAGRLRPSAQRIPAAGRIVERLAGDVAGLGKLAQAIRRSRGSGEVGFGRTKVSLGLSNFLRAGARFSRGEQGTGLGCGGFRLSDLFGAEAPGQLIGPGRGFGQAGFGLAQAGAEFSKVEATSGASGSTMVPSSASTSVTRPPSFDPTSMRRDSTTP